MHARSWPGNVSFFTSCQSSVSNIQPLSRINLNSWAKTLNDIPTCEVAGWSRGGSKRLTIDVSAAGRTQGAEPVERATLCRSMEGGRKAFISRLQHIL